MRVAHSSLNHKLKIIKAQHKSIVKVIDASIYILEHKKDSIMKRR